MENQPAQTSKLKKIGIAISVIFTVSVILLSVIFIINRKLNHQKTDSKNDYYSFENMESTIFSIPEYDDLPNKYRVCIYNYLYSNNYLSTNELSLTKIKDRATGVYCFGNFSDRDDADESNKELTVIFDHSNFSSATLCIFNSECELLYSNEYYNLPSIKHFHTGAKIYLDKMELVPAPCEGLVVNTKDEKNVLIYDKATKSFIQYYQYTEEDIKRGGREEYDEEGELIEETTENINDSAGDSAILEK